MFATYLKLGITHILDMGGLDHLLFLVVLVICFQWKNWKAVLLLATAFTVGHSITLALAAMNMVKVDSERVELLIALSIALTAAYNLLRPIREEQGWARYCAALAFGLIHGLGFSNFFRTILGTDSIVGPLLAFNLGVEVAQAIIVMAVLVVLAVIYKFIKNAQKPVIYFTSAIILLWSMKMVVERL